MEAAVLGMEDMRSDGSAPLPPLGFVGLSHNFMPPQADIKDGHGSKPNAEWGGLLVLLCALHGPPEEDILAATGLLCERSAVVRAPGVPGGPVALPAYA
eukprot:4094070-Heterocapsa_arctica.AAC.1